MYYIMPDTLMITNAQIKTNVGSTLNISKAAGISGELKNGETLMQIIDLNSSGLLIEHPLGFRFSISLLNYSEIYKYLHVVSGYIACKMYFVIRETSSTKAIWLVPANCPLYDQSIERAAELKESVSDLEIGGLYSIRSKSTNYVYIGQYFYKKPSYPYKFNFEVPKKPSNIFVNLNTGQVLSLRISSVIAKVGNATHKLQEATAIFEHDTGSQFFDSYDVGKESNANYQNYGYSKIECSEGSYLFYDCSCVAKIENDKLLPLTNFRPKGILKINEVQIKTSIRK